MDVDLEKTPTRELFNYYSQGDNNFEIADISVVSSSQSPLVETPSTEIEQPNAPLLIVPLVLLATAWGISLSSRLGFRKTIKKNINHIKCLNKIPCSQCRFFENSIHLKCAVHPLKVSNPQAVNCPDFWPVDSKRFYSY